MGPLGVNSAAFGLVSGRVSAIAFDPSDATGNHVYIGTTGGGVWASQNAAGAAGSVVFSPLTDRTAAVSNTSGSPVPQASVSVGAVSVQPGATGVILAGLGDPNDALDSYYGAGLLRSTDGGVTWTLIEQTVDREAGLSAQDYSFVGESFAGFSWSTVSPQLVVAAVSQAYEGTLVGAGLNQFSMEGLYYSQDAGATWHLARITDLNGLDVQGPQDPFPLPDGNAATAVVWNPVRRVFVAAIRYHGYYQSADGVTWTRMADAPNGQPGTALNTANCPTEPGSVGVAGCPIFRGALAVNPSTGDTFAWTVDAFNQDQGLWQDQCVLSGTGNSATCSDTSFNFGLQLPTGPLEIADGNGTATIPNGDYNLVLAAVPGGLGTGQDTLLFAGANDLWKCSLANSCQWRNTTNATTCASANVGEYQHAVAWDAGNPLLIAVGNDSGLWRSTDQIGETGTVCAASDASHWQNLNGAISGSLAEVVALGQASATAATMFTGLGANGFAGIVNAPATPASWNQVLGGEGGPVAITQGGNLNSWYANNAAGVSIFRCNSATACTPQAFGTAAAIGETQVANDGLAMPFPAQFRLDQLDPSQVLIGTCRVWRGPANGSGWSASNAISPILDGTGGSVCNGNSLIRSIATLQLAGGGEAIYVGMAGLDDGGGVIPGHIFYGILSTGGTVANWTDLTLSPVGNSGLAFNAFGFDVTSIFIDPHDGSGATVYATIGGISGTAAQLQTVYRSTDAGAHWTAIAANLPNAPANAVVVDTQDPNTVYVATDTGVYITRSVAACGTGACWAVYGTGLPLSPVTALIATPVGASSQILTAGTYGRGIWQIPLVTAGTQLTTMSYSPSSLTFASQAVGTSSVTQSLTLKATGTAPLTVTAIGFTGAAAPDYSESDTCVGISLAKNATCAVKVTFSPTQSGVRNAQVAVQANISGGQQLIPVTGTGTAGANITLLPSSVAFGNQQVGKTSATQNLSLQNTGGTQLAISSIAVTTPFLKSSTTCGTTLAAGASCSIAVAFSPTQAGSATGTATIADTAGTQSAVLSGVGIAGPGDTLSATTLTFPNTVAGQASAPMTVQLTNTGGLPLTGIGTSVSGANAADFAAVSNCGGILAANSSCGVSVTFRPSAVKYETATLTVSDALRAQNVALSGAGLKPPAIAVSPASLALGSVQVGVASAAKPVTITNTGGSPLAQPSFTFSGPAAASFSLGTSTCGATLASGASCTVQVLFLPVASGAATASLTVSTSSSGVAAATVGLTGTGLTPPAILVSPAAQNFGTVIVGNASAAFTIQVTNTGQVAISGLSFAVNGISGPAGALASDFALSAPTDVPACALSGGSLAASATCSVHITFSPSVAGVESATLTATAANAVPSSATVSLTGTGSPTLLLQPSPASESFPATAVGTTSAAQSVTISNIGRQSANSLAFNFTGPYSLAAASSTCKLGAKIPAGSFCTAAIAFAPTATGDQPGSLSVSVTNLGVAPALVSLDGTGVAIGGILPSPTQMTFGSVLVNAISSAQTLTITNTGQGTLAGLNLSVSGPFALASNSCPGSLAAGAACTVSVTFKPPTIGSLTGTLTISTTSQGVAPALVGLTGNGIPSGSLIANPAVVSFGAITVGQTGPTQSVTLTNTGPTTLTSLAFQLAGDYSLPSNTCGVSLTSASACTFTVSFAPSQPGTRNGSVTITGALQPSNAAIAPLVVGLAGTGLAAAQLVVTPTQLAFGQVPVGTNSTALQLTVKNPGTGSLTGLSFAVAAPFSAGSGSCGAILPAGGTCGVPITFTPTTPGSQSGTIVVSSTSVGVPTVLVPVSGVGLAPASLSVSPSSLSFPATTVGVQSPGQTVTVSNAGGVALAGLSLVISGSAAKDFALGSSNCGTTLAAGAACSVVMTFTPSATGGRTGFLTATSSTAGVAATSATLNGTGLAPASLIAKPPQISFGAVLTGQTGPAQFVTVTNSGGSPIADLALGVTIGFALDPTTTTCGKALPAGASCTVGVLFSPLSVGAVTGSLNATSASTSTSTTVALAGTGALAPGASPSPAQVLFGTTSIGQSAQPITVTIANQGTQSALTGLALAVDASGASAGFGLSSDTCSGKSLAVAATCTVNVTFTPKLAGRLTGNLVISSANGGGPVNVALGGIGFSFTFYAVGNSSMTVVRGQTAYYTLAVSPQSLPAGASSGLVTFQCGALPANVICLFNPSQFASLKATGTVTLGLSTGAATSASLNAAPKWGGVALLVCSAILLPLKMRSRLYFRRFCVLIWLAGVIGILGGCAGAGGSGGQTHPGGGTPPGTYPVTVSATSNGLTETAKLVLIVN